jgi:preprotein translocase subunit SecA
MLGSINKTLKKIIGNKSDRDIKGIMPLVSEINAIFDTLSSLSHDQLRDKTAEFKSKIEDYIREEKEQIEQLRIQVDADHNMDLLQKEAMYGDIDNLEKTITEKIEVVLNDILPEAFAVLKETARRFKENSTIRVKATDHDREIAPIRTALDIEGDDAIWKNTWMAAGGEITWNMVHYDVQLIGGVVLHQGRITEMQTGEGKTLVATLPLYLNALSGRGAHLVTVNDYLARRDSEWMGPLFEFHGLTVACIDNSKPHSDERKAAYKADITYGTNNEFGFDYLRDNMASTPRELVQPPHNYSIVDEVDSVLIDEARTPLIISGPTPKGDEHHFDELKPKVELLVREQRKLVNNLLVEAKKKLNLTESDVSDKKKLNKEQEAGRLALFRSYRALPKNKALIKFLSEPGIRTAMQKTENFYLQEQGKRMPEVDQELFFVIDEKSNSVELTEKGIELVTGATEDRDFFILPDIASILSQINNEELDEKDKLKKKEDIMADYSVKAERLHTVDKLLKAYCMFEKDVDYVVMDNQVKIVDEQTGRMMEGRRYSDGLHQAIEAKEKVKIEAATQTYATITLQNYFRMYNKLAGMTGTAETEAGEFWEIYKLDVVVIPTNRPNVRNDDQDLVFKTAREKYNAAIDEIVKLRQAGRPVLVGTTSVEVSELMSRMLKIRKVPHQVLNAKLHQKEAEIVAEAGKTGTVTIATNMAGRGTDIKLTDEVKKAGGLAIIGTERHESRRIDRQLRGRSGRQGDPGSSQFYVSLEDNLMRLFGSDRIAKLMDRMGHKEGEVIQHSMITKSIERAQKKVEENNFGIRKRLLEYDDVMNQQREVIYKRRKHALYGERLKVDIANAIYDLTEGLVESYRGSKDFETFKLDVFATLHVEPTISEEDFLNSDTKQLSDSIYEQTLDNYMNRQRDIAKMAFPVVKRVHEDPSTNYENIVVPFTDGRKSIQVVANLERSYLSQGVELTDALEKSVMLAMIDQYWKEHLREMDDLRQSVQSAVYEQKDPLLIYKFESFELFKKMIDKVSQESISFLIRANLPQAANDQVRQAPVPRIKTRNLQERKDELPSEATGGQQYHDPTAGQHQEKVKPFIKTEKTIGRNEKVQVVNEMTGESKTVKYKQALPMIESGQWRLNARS